MPAQVTLAVTAGPSVGQQHVFTERTTALIGRDKECHIRFPNDKDHQTVSRHHCLLDINPPEGCIRDLGSRSGTFINGKLIGKRDRAQSAQEGAKLQFAEHGLKDGDEIKLGKVVLRVAITSPVLCTQCLTEVPAQEREQTGVAGGEYTCEKCRSTLPPRV